MEFALNLGWLVLTLLLCAGCVEAWRRERLHVPLGPALGCCCLLACLLFPVISMTDDLQQGSLEMEGRVRALSLVNAAALPSALLLTATFHAMVFLWALARTRLLWLAAPRERRLQLSARMTVALAVRPPTVFRAAFA